MPKPDKTESPDDHGQFSCMGQSPVGLDPFLSTGLEPVVQSHDYVFQIILHNEPRFAKVFGLDFAVYQLVALRLAGRRGHALVPDATLFVSLTPEDKWERILQSEDLKKEIFTLVNLELVKELDPGRDADQVWSNLQAFRNQLGRLFDLLQMVVVTHSPSGERPRRLRLSGKNTFRRAKARIVYLDECRAADLPESVLNNPFGAAGALLCGDGFQEKYLVNAFEQWYNVKAFFGPVETIRFWAEVLELRPGLRDLYEDFVQKIILEESMTMEENAEARAARIQENILFILNAHMNAIPDPTRVDRVRELIQQERRHAEQERRHAEQERRHAEQERRRAERATQQTHVALLLEALQERNIELSAQQQSQLKKMNCEDLPGMGIALAATDAEDFARRAQLSADE